MPKGVHAHHVTPPGFLPAGRRYAQSQPGRAQRSATSLALWAKPRYRARQVAAAKASWRDPTAKAARIATLKAALSNRRERLGLPRRCERRYAQAADTLRRHGLSPIDAALLFEQQHGMCPVCSRPLPNDWVVDHDHGSNTVRGLLHAQCNSGLRIIEAGYAQAAVAYLKNLNWQA